MAKGSQTLKEQVEAALLSDCDVHLDDIWGDCAQQAARYAYWLSVLSEQQLKLETVEAAIDAALRDAPGGKKPTEAAIERAMALQPQWVIEKSLVDKIRALVDGLRQRYGMLQALAGNERRQPTTEFSPFVSESQRLRERSSR